MWDSFASTITPIIEPENDQDHGKIVGWDTQNADWGTALFLRVFAITVSSISTLTMVVCAIFRNVNVDGKKVVNICNYLQMAAPILYIPVVPLEQNDEAWAIPLVFFLVQNLFHQPLRDVLNQKTKKEDYNEIKGATSKPKVNETEMTTTKIN
jgi:hypothetical protein